VTTQKQHALGVAILNWIEAEYVLLVPAAQGFVFETWNQPQVEGNGHNKRHRGVVRIAKR
jgi:hypothetical protein